MSESIYTTASGNACEYEVLIENGQSSVSAVWSGRPTEADLEEFRNFITNQADRAGFRHAGAEDVLLGSITMEELPRVRDIVKERTERRFLDLGEVIDVKFSYPKCLYCEEPVLLTELAEDLSNGVVHVECGIRMVMGSAAHQLGECSCYGGHREDPPSMTKREAAKLAAEVFGELSRSTT